MDFSGNWRLVFFAILVCTCPSVSSAECPQDREDCHFTVLTTKFESDNPELGANVALALQHQIFRNFLISIPAEAGDICCFPRDTIAVLARPLARQTRAEAERRGRQGHASVLVLWGRAWPWREYIVVQPYLSVIAPPSGLDPLVRVCCTNTSGIERRRPFTRQGDWNVWEISARDSVGNSRVLAIDEFPSDFYELPQISLGPDEVARFGSLAGLPVYDGINGNPIPGVRTSNVIEADQHVGDWTRITEPRGWIRLPTVNAGPIIEFVGGIVYFLRGNWERAEASFREVIADPSAYSGIRVDAALLLAATRFRLDPGCSGCSDAIAIAKSISPYSEVTAQFELMAGIAAAKRPGDYQLLLDRLADQHALYPGDAAFTRRARVFLSAMAQPQPE